MKIQAGMWAQMMHAASSGRVRGTHSHSSAVGGGDVLTTLSPFLKIYKKKKISIKMSGQLQSWGRQVKIQGEAPKYVANM